MYVSQTSDSCLLALANSPAWTIGHCDSRSRYCRPLGRYDPNSQINRFFPPRDVRSRATPRNSVRRTRNRRTLRPTLERRSRLPRRCSPLRSSRCSKSFGRPLPLDRFDSPLWKIFRACSETRTYEGRRRSVRVLRWEFGDSFDEECFGRCKEGTS